MNWNWNVATNVGRKMVMNIGIIIMVAYKKMPQMGEVKK